MPARTVVVDCDPGLGVPGANVDDGLALALALTSPVLDVAAVSVTAGNTPRDVGLRSARALLDVAGAEVPLLAGATTALVEDPAPWRSRLDEPGRRPEVRALWDRAMDDAEVPAAGDAVSVLGELLRSRPGEVAVLALGPLTTVARLLASDPEVAGAVAEVVVMGGAFDVPGLVRDTNVGMDPEAASAVLRSGAPVTLVPADVTRTTSLTREDLDRITASGTPLAAYLRATVRPWLEHVARERAEDSCYLHDALVVAAAVEPGLVRVEEREIDVLLDPPDRRGVTVTRAAGQGARARVVTEADNSALLDLLARTLA